MAVTKPTPRDIGTYEPKLIGPFTKRQVLCIGGNAIPAVLIGSLVNGLTSDSYTMIVVIMILMIPGIFLAYGHIFCQGMKPEDFVLEYYYYHTKSSNIRRYETVTLDDSLDIVRQKKIEKELKEHESMDSKKKNQKKSKKNKSEQKDKESITKTKHNDPRFTPRVHKKNKNYKEIT